MRKDKFKVIKIVGVSICAGFTLLCLILFGFYGYNYSKDLKKLAQKNSRQVALEKDVENLKTLLQRYKEERKELETLLFSDKDIAEFLDKMGEFTKKSQVKIVDMRTQKFSVVKPPEEISRGLPLSKKDSAKKKEEAGASLAFLPINMTVESSFSRLIDFLLSLEKYRQLLTLSNVSIKRTANYPLLNCKFVLRLYSLKQIEELVK